ncbi:DUF1294 domain-containing protein [Rhizobium sp. WL3]|uniref:DUF1294 domain-containing protein n=1 Tax=Rhizobium sp. WL3 TaxID=2603277 RepID=UPI001AEF0DDE|nr:DUF1294 domain-containing protein [Rhizobium sp. WL3]
MSNFPIPSPTLLAAILILAWNFGVMLLFGIDKRAAVHGLRRVPERRLIKATVFFGAVGAFLGQRLFRHKTRKAPFTWLVPTMLAVQIAAMISAPLFIAGLQNSWP